MPTATRTRNANKPDGPTRVNLAAKFKQWLAVRDQADQTKERQDQLRLELLAEVARRGKKSAEGHVFFELAEPIEFKDRKGKVKIFSSLKRQFALRPANPVPDLDLAEDLLREKDLWLSEKDEENFRKLRARFPLFKIDVSLDIDAYADLVFKRKITDAEYEATLAPQQEVYSFIPVEE